VVGSLCAANRDTRVASAEQALLRGDYSGAYNRSTKFLKNYPDDVKAIVIAGRAGLALATARPPVLLQESASRFRRALELAPETPGVHYFLGLCVFRMAEDGNGDQSGALYLEAAEQFSEELLLTPGYVQAIEGRAVALGRAGAWEAATEAHEAWIAARPGEFEPYVSLGTVLAHSNGDVVAVLGRTPPELVPEVAFRLSLDLWGAGRVEAFRSLTRALNERVPDSWQAIGLSALDCMSRAECTDITPVLRFAESESPHSEKLRVFTSFVDPSATDGSFALPRGTVRFNRVKAAPIGYPEVLPRWMRFGTERVVLLAVVAKDGSLRPLFPLTQNHPLYLQAVADALGKWATSPPSSTGNRETS